MLTGLSHDHIAKMRCGRSGSRSVGLICFPRSPAPLEKIRRVEVCRQWVVILSSEFSEHAFSL